MFRGTSEHQQPQPSITHVSIPLSYPTTRATPDAVQTSTDAFLASMHETKLDNDTAEPTKRPKQHHAMAVKDHLKLTIPTQVVTMGDTTHTHTPGGQQYVHLAVLRFIQ